MKHVTITAVVFLLAITQGSAEFQCPSATFVELGKGVLIDCLISDVNDIYWLRGTEEDHYPIVKIEMGLKTISKIAQDHFDITDSGALVIRDASNDLTGSYVMLHYRTNHVKEVDTVTLNVTKLIDSIITQGPSGGVFPVGSTITLSCTFQKGYVVGWKEFENKDIFLADTKVTADTKYDNFRVSLSDGISSLLIIGADLEDAGDYSCNTKSYAHVEIEAPPSLRIMFNVTDDEGTNSTDSHGVIDITCSARNARPAVMIRFKTDGSEWINPSETWTVSKGMTFDTSATLKYNFRTNQTDGFITCQSFGQTSVSAMEKTIHLYLPICNITISGNEVRCTCQANPPVEKYRMELNGNLQDGDVLYIEESNSANVTCFGTNGMGTGLSSLLFPGNKAEAGVGIFSTVVMISVAIVLSSTCCLAVVCIKRKFTSRGEKSDGTAAEQNDALEMEPLNNGKIQVEDRYCGCLYPITKPSKQRALKKVLNDICYRICHTDGVRDDVELFLVEVLEVSPNVLQQALLGDGSFEERVRKILDSFLNVSKERVTKEMLMERINTKNNICKDYRLQQASDIYREVKVATQAVSGTKEEAKIEPRSFDEMMKICGSLIGKVAVQRLFADQSSNLISNLYEHYGEDDTQFMSGSAFVRHLNDLQLVKDNMDSIRDFMETIERVHQYRSCKCILHYIQKVVPNDLDETIQKISKSTELQQDLETVAIDVWRIETAVVEDVVTSSTMIQDQIKILVKKWIEQNPDKATKSSLEEDSVYMGESLIAKYCNSEVSDEGKAIGKFESQVTICYKECLSKCGVLCGKLGGSKLLEKYGLQFPNSNPEKTGSDALQILQKKNKITNECSSMAKLHQTLISINLFRAEKLIEGYLTGLFKSDEERLTLIL